MIGKLAIVGVGLIGGSLARAAKRAGIVSEVVGIGRDDASLQRGVELGVIDRFTTDIGSGVADADMVVIAVPLATISKLLPQLKASMPADAVLTDVGSAKASVVEDVRTVFGQIPANFVPGHPIAGTEKSGVEASFAELFDNRRVILTPLPESAPEAIAKVRLLWEQAGAEVIEMGVEHHDEVLAATSHLPHVLAYALVDALARGEQGEEIFRYAAGGFRDFSRIASSHPVMWRDICLANRGAILKMLKHFTDDLNEIADSIEKGDGDHLLELFSRAKAARDRYCG
ncbi:prephenate dehydrogenase [Solemya pervernicosa gill symbiont]|uniref:prephenate dehydrogenase n=2 Tax=Gammaproteobacteria incertae sedis TaxID=118884 RepID=A0A1T2L3P7_9GAMM|nr:prephenate dehydrogenase/arogenate dehydrogenase family protein [Candidatus Reidiella endopervernicosa]OOZ39738.1 prephenate dehydrogenase [Solemya pervernicosa gill symbiont]QKQ26655.1 prephenate dehydrogenase/arogenate dehydrogenase family protein [Candidatus Reidiella endopervernicosa]